jgi:hypothetical protein
VAGQPQGIRVVAPVLPGTAAVATIGAAGLATRWASQPLD